VAEALRLLVLALVLLTQAQAQAQKQTQAPADAARTPASEAAWQATAAMGQGVNFGNIFEAPKEGDWGLRMRDDFFALVGEGTPIQSVRLPVRWSNNASPDAQARIDPAFLARVTQAVDRLLARGVIVILNQHHYRQLDGDALDPGELAAEAGVVEARFLSLWRQIAEHFKDRGPRLLFEIYNEPHGRLNERWNDLLSQALPIIRASNPTRLVVVGPTHWNSATALPALRLPNDPHLVLTVHHYEPFNFTHQGAEWVQPPKPTGQTCCSDQQLAEMRAPLDQAVAYARERGLPLFVGEWGACSKAPLAARLRYVRLMRQLLAERRLPWQVWELASGFGFYDPERREWRSDLYQALFPQAAGPGAVSQPRPSTN
jgi:endoglucanase